jgi:hypothetical protein
MFRVRYIKPNLGPSATIFALTLGHENTRRDFSSTMSLVTGEPQLAHFVELLKNETCSTK